MPLPELSDEKQAWYILQGYEIFEDPPCNNERRIWALNEELHREDGSAVENADGVHFWYLDGVSIKPNVVLLNRYQIYSQMEKQT